MKLIKTNINSGKVTTKVFDIISFEEREDRIVFTTDAYEAEFTKAIATVTSKTDDEIAITVNWD